MVRTIGTFAKDLLRTTAKSLMRFLSILAITALGVGFYAGIKATAPDMILSADRYFQEQQLADFYLISPLGFTEDDLAQIRQIDGVAIVQTGYIKDVYLTTAEGVRATVRLTSAAGDTPETLNRTELVSGRQIQSSGELVLDERTSALNGITLGQSVTLTLPAGEDPAASFQTLTFQVVGLIRSPVYISFERGQTSIGDGSIDCFAQILASDFISERVSTVAVRTSQSPDLRAYSQQYEAHLEPLATVLNALGETSIGDQTQIWRDELSQGKAELEASKAVAEQELAAAEQKLLEAETAIRDGETELTGQEERYRAELAEQRQKLVSGRSDYNAGMVRYFESYQVWIDGYTAWQDGRDQLSNAKATLDDSKNKLDQAERELALAKIQLDAAAIQLQLLDTTLQSLVRIRQSLPETTPTLPDAEFNRLIGQIRTYAPELADFIEAQYQSGDAQTLEQLVAFLDASTAQLQRTQTEAQIEYAAGQAAYQNGLREWEAGKLAYAQGLLEYEQGAAKLDASRRQLDAGKTELDQARLKLDAAKAKLDSGELALAKGEAQLNRRIEDGRLSLADARAELETGRAAYAAEKADALQKIAAAEADIRESERQLLEIPQQWMVYDRAGNPGYTGYGDDAGRIAAVAGVFPFFFFLVATLVCLTTMTRMIEEERLQIGTRKALGYGTWPIAAKYLAYALSASLAGSALGLALGFKIFPTSIMSAYGIMYQIPVLLTPFHLGDAVVSLLLAIGTTVLAALLAALHELRQVPAVLMQPRAPKPGKRIFLEAIEPIWRRLSFSQKLAARNIFRYKQRLIMTAIGISGCTALLLTGFGLKDSINAILTKQFGEIFLYDGQLIFDPDHQDAIEPVLTGQPEISAWLAVAQETVTVLDHPRQTSISASLVVPADTSAFATYYDLHDRQTRFPLSVGGDGAIITEKLAELLGIGVGDMLRYRDADSRTYSVRISGIAENYVSHFIYLSSDGYDRITYRTPVFNSAVFNLNDAADLDAVAFQERLLTHSAVLGSMLTRTIAEDFAKTINSLNFVVLILILSAGALAFVVLYNLISINVTERIREIATIKVLGFRDWEVSAYVFRENIVITVIGTLAGLGLGVFLHRFVMNTMEIDNMMFGKSIGWLSYLLSVLLTLSFALVVNSLMHVRLRRVKMVESLKSVE
jgi:putative ABC transport system permease protein